MKNKLKEKMLRGEKTLGTFHELGSASVIECIGYAGFDYVVIDSEHGPFETETALNYIRAARSVDLVPLVRVKDSSRGSILKMLDVGAMGLIIPNINSVEEVRELVNYGKYFPVGQRGGLPPLQEAGFGSRKHQKKVWRTSSKYQTKKASCCHNVKQGPALKI